MISEQFFQTYGNLEINFGINLDKSFWYIVNNFGVTLRFVKILTHFKTDLKLFGMYL